MRATKKGEKWLFSWLFFFLPLFLLTNCKSPSIAEISGDVALYADQGADEDCIKATMNMFQWMGYSVKYVTAENINTQGSTTLNPVHSWWRY
ncbi:unnamed protein product, partial [marine sediment metagenome]